MVLDDPVNSESQQRPFQNPNGSFHPLANLPWVSPPAQSMEVTLQTLENAYEAFEWEHTRGLDRDYKPKGGVDGAKCRCCGFQPLPRPKLPVQSAIVVGADITVRDFVTQVHAWLLSLEDSILRAVAEPPHFMGEEKRPPGGRFWVRFNVLPQVVELYDEGGLGKLERLFTDMASKAHDEIEGTFLFSVYPATMCLPFIGNPEHGNEINSQPASSANEHEDPPTEDLMLKYYQWMDTVDLDNPTPPPPRPPKPKGWKPSVLPAQPPPQRRS